MRIGQVSRQNINQYVNSQNVNADSNKTNNEFSKNLFKFEKRFEPTDMKFNKFPNWSSIATKSESYGNQDNIIKDIKALAKKHFTAGINPNLDSEYKKLENEFISKVSPDRKAIFEDSMSKTGNKMNAACSFFDEKGSVVMTYNPHNSTYSPRLTESEFARARLFKEMYNEEHTVLEQNVDYEDLRATMSQSTYDYKL